MFYGFWKCKVRADKTKIKFTIKHKNKFLKLVFNDSLIKLWLCNRTNGFHRITILKFISEKRWYLIRRPGFDQTQKSSLALSTNFYPNPSQIFSSFEFISFLLFAFFHFTSIYRQSLKLLQNIFLFRSANKV